MDGLQPSAPFELVAQTLDSTIGLQTKPKMRVPVRDATMGLNQAIWLGTAPGGHTISTQAWAIPTANLREQAAGTRGPGPSAAPIYPLTMKRWILDLRPSRDHGLL